MTPLAAGMEDTTTMPIVGSDRSGTSVRSSVSPRLGRSPARRTGTDPIPEP
jgi:hypothetical protein